MQRRHRPKGSGSIIALAEGKWRIGYDVATAEPGQPRNPRKQKFEVVTGTKMHAEVKLRERQQAAGRGELAGDDAVTFAMLGERYIADRRLAGKQETTVRLYERLLKHHVLPVLGHRKARDVKAKDIVRLLNEARDRSNRKPGKTVTSLGPTAKRALRTLIGAVLRHGVKHGVIVRNECALVPVPAEPFREPKVIGVDDAVAYIEAARGTPLETIVLTAVATGMRRQELCGLRLPDVNWETGAYRVSRAVKVVGSTVIVDKCKTKRSARSDNLPALALVVLKAHRLRQEERLLKLDPALRPQDPYLFDDGLGGPQDPGVVTRAWGALVKDKGLPPCRFHDLRGAFASIAFANGISLKVISESLGHSDISVTSRVYAHLMPTTLAEKSAVMDGVLGSALRKSAGHNV